MQTPKTSSEPRPPQITVRRAEPGDYEAVSRIFSGPKAVWGTLQIPFASAEVWRQRLLEPAEGMLTLVACAGDEVIGNLGLRTFLSVTIDRHRAISQHQGFISCLKTQRENG